LGFGQDGGAALLLLGLGLQVAEAFAPSFGILGLGGLLVFVVGAGMLLHKMLPSKST
jgi:membrane-bound serine protease (ClpP class)